MYVSQRKLRPTRMTTPKPSSALTPQVMLATAMHSQPGVYAVLLGSGVSTGAGIPTGWGVVKHLVRCVAAASSPEDGDALRQAEDDPEAWWRDHGKGDLGYSTLLEALAPTAATRQGILAGFFEPSEQDREEGIKVPSKAHEALAQLVKRGTVKVILTTNFDRLTEQALEAAGVSPQVISHPSAVTGMAPLAHASATVVKLHGDYLDLGSRNTPQELEDYPGEWNRLLDQVFDEYGLLVSGWSADWDTALVAALERAPSRRYPLYWDSRSSKGEPAQRLLKARRGQVIGVANADELFCELLHSVEALERLAEPPLSTAMAVARLKRYLPNPIRRIDLHDLVMNATEHVVQYIAEQPVEFSGLDGAGMQTVYERYLEATTPLLQLVTVGVWHDQDDAHGDLWRDVLQRLVNSRIQPSGNSLDSRLCGAQHYPALLTLQSMGVAAVRRERDALLLRLLTEVEWHDPFSPQEEISPAAHVLRSNGILEPDVVNSLPRWNRMTWDYPASHMLKMDLRQVLRDLIPDDADYQSSVHNYEYRVGFVQENTQDAPNARRLAGGEFVRTSQWTEDNGPLAEIAFRKAAVKASVGWPWRSLIGKEEAFDDQLFAYRKVLKQYRR